MGIRFKKTVEKKVTVTKEPEVQSLQICVKAYDCNLLNASGEEVHSFWEQVPGIQLENGHGYIHVDIETGQIIGWVTPTTESIELMIDEK